MSAADDTTLLRLLWLASPALPVGAFSYSEALESAVEQGRVGDEAGALAWLRDHLLLVQARADLALAAAALDAWRAGDADRVVALNLWLQQTRESAEFRLQAGQTGRALADWLGQRATGDQRLVALLDRLQPAPAWPVVFALAAGQAGATARQTLLALAFGWAENMVQAAVKAVPLGQSAGQRMLARLAEEIPAAVDDALARDDATRQAFTPMLAIVSAQHETQYSRLFRS